MRKSAVRQPRCLRFLLSASVDPAGGNVMAPGATRQCVDCPRLEARRLQSISRLPKTLALQRDEIAFIDCHERLGSHEAQAKCGCVVCDLEAMNCLGAFL